jgi:hypothetical protein
VVDPSRGTGHDALDLLCQRGVSCLSMLALT